MKAAVRQDRAIDFSLSDKSKTVSKTKSKNKNYLLGTVFTNWVMGTLKAQISPLCSIYACKKSVLVPSKYIKIKDKWDLIKLQSFCTAN